MLELLSREESFGEGYVELLPQSGGQMLELLPRLGKLDGGFGGSIPLSESGSGMMARFC